MNKKLFLVMLLVGMFSISLANVGVLHDKAGSWGAQFERVNSSESNGIAGYYLFNPNLELMAGYASISGGSTIIVGGEYYFLKEYMNQPIYVKANLSYANVISTGVTTYGATIGYKYVIDKFVIIPSLTWSSSIVGGSTTYSSAGDLLISYMLAKGQYITGSMDGYGDSFAVMYSTEL